MCILKRCIVVHNKRNIMTKLSVVVFLIVSICVLLGDSQAIIYEALGKSLASHMREGSRGGGGSSSPQTSSDRDWMNRGEDYNQYRDGSSQQQRQQAQKSSSSDGVYSMQRDSKRENSRSGSADGGSYWE